MQFANLLRNDCIYRVGSDHRSGMIWAVDGSNNVVIVGEKCVVGDFEAANFLS